MQTEDIQKRMLLIIDKFAGGNKSKFCRLTGIPTPSLQKYVDENRAPAHKHLISIWKNLSVSIDWLLTGQGEMVQTGESENPKVEEGMVNYNEIVQKLVDAGDKETLKEVDHLFAEIARKHKGIGPALRNMPKKA